MSCDLGAYYQAGVEARIAEGTPEEASPETFSAGYVAGFPEGFSAAVVTPLSEAWHRLSSMPRQQNVTHLLTEHPPLLSEVPNNHFQAPLAMLPPISSSKSCQPSSLDCQLQASEQVAASQQALWSTNTPLAALAESWHSTPVQLTYFLSADKHDLGYADPMNWDIRFSTFHNMSGELTTPVNACTVK